MAIPSTFRAKYSLDKETYVKADVDAALSDLFAVSKKLAEENAIKKNTIEQLSKDYSTASVRAETLEGEVRRILAENEQINRKNSFLEAENKSLKEKIDNIRKNPPVSYEYEMIQKSVSATAAAAEKLIAINSDLASRVEELEYRLDSLVSCFYGAGRKELKEENPVAEPEASVPAEEQKTADTSEEENEIEIELYEIPADDTAARDENGEAGTAAAEEAAAQDEAAVVIESCAEIEENKNPVSGVLYADEAEEPASEEAAEPEEPVFEEIKEPEEPVIEEAAAAPKAEEPAEPVIEEITAAVEATASVEAAEPEQEAPAVDNELVSKIRQSLENQNDTVTVPEETKEEAPAPKAEETQPAEAAKTEDRRMNDMMSRLAAIRKKLEDKN